MFQSVLATKAVPLAAIICVLDVLAGIASTTVFRVFSDVPYKSNRRSRKKQSQWPFANGVFGVSSVGKREKKKQTFAQATLP